MPSYIVRGRIIARNRDEALRSFMSVSSAKWAEIEDGPLDNSTLEGRAKLERSLLYKLGKLERREDA